MENNLRCTNKNASEQLFGISYETINLVSGALIEVLFKAEEKR